MECTIYGAVFGVEQQVIPRQMGRGAEAFESTARPSGGENDEDDEHLCSSVLVRARSRSSALVRGRSRSFALVRARSCWFVHTRQKQHTKGIQVGIHYSFQFQILMYLWYIF